MSEERKRNGPRDGSRGRRMPGLAAVAAILATAAAGDTDSIRAANIQAVARWTQTQRQQAGTNRWFASGLVADRGERTVTFAAEAVGLERGATVEFLLVEPASDRDYESLAVALAQPSDIARALEYIGMPPGVPVSPGRFRFWPKGERVTMGLAPFQGGRSDPVSLWVTNRESKTPFFRDLVYVGRSDAPKAIIGPRDNTGAAPGSVAATYNEPSALLDVPDRSFQGEVYGNRVAGELLLQKGALLLVTLRAEPLPDGRPRVVEVQIAAQPAPTNAPAGLAGVQLCASSADPAFPTQTLDVAGTFQRLAGLARANRDPFVGLTFDDRLTVAAARDLARALEAIEGKNGIRVDEPPAGQLYFKAFLPQDKWRDRKQRLSQPLELRITRRDSGWTKMLVQIREDFSKTDQLDPELTVIEHPLAAWDELPKKIKTLGGGLNTLLVFVPADAPLSAFMPGVRLLAETQPVVFVFPE